MPHTSTKLLAYNLTGDNLDLAAGNTPVSLPPSQNAPEQGPAINVTAALKGLSAADYTLIQAQVSAGLVSFYWDGAIGYDTRSLQAVFTPTSVDGSALALLYRPGATGADAEGAFVFPYFEDLYETYLSVRSLGNIEIQFDARFSSDFSPEGRRSCLIPARLDPDNPGSFLKWDVAGTIWTDWVARSGGFGQNITFADNCTITTSEGSLHFHARDGLEMSHDSEVSSPFEIFGEVNLTGTFIRLYNTNPLAKPMFQGLGFMLLEAHSQPCFLGGRPNSVEKNGADCVAPLFHNGGGMLAIGWHGAFACDSAFAGPGPLLNIMGERGPQGPFTWTFPEMTNKFLILVFNKGNKHGGRWQSFAYDDADVYTGVATATPHTANVDAYHNDIVPVDTAGGAFTVTAPTATVAMGEKFTVKDSTGNCTTTPVLIAPRTDENIEGPDGMYPDETATQPTIDNDRGYREWTSDGLGNWILTGKI